MEFDTNILSSSARESVTWELYTTSACNLNCIYCYNATNSVERREPAYAISELVSFFNQYARNGDCLSFIGGEPFIRSDWMAEVLLETQRFDFICEAYTNGVYLKSIPETLLNRFSTLLISIDGDETCTDRTRGTGTYSKIIENLETVAPYFNGKMIARLTVTPDNDLERSVKSLLNLPYFTAVYWQYQNNCGVTDYPIEQKWKELDNLLDFWMEHLRCGRVLPLQTFKAITARLLTQERHRPDISTHPLSSDTLGCGAGNNYFQIDTTGDIYACPEIIGQRHNLLGNIRKGMQQLVGLNDFPNTHKCYQCSEFEICHCRCLHCTPDDYCKLIRNTIARLRDALPEIEAMLDARRLSPEDFQIIDRLEEMF